MIPRTIPIRRVEEYHTEYLGTYGEKQQYMGFPFFAASGQKRPVATLHLFDSSGAHIESKIFENEKMYLAEAELKQAVANLPNHIPGNVNIAPFEVELNNLTVGLIPREDGKCLVYQPYGLAFFPPWDGTYET